MASARDGANEVHALAIYRDQMNKEFETARQWKENWGFLAVHDEQPPRGFSETSVKYIVGQGKWVNARKRVPDGSSEGLAAAASEQASRTRLSMLEESSMPTTLVKPCRVVTDGSDRECVVDDTSGIQSKDVAKMMTAHNVQALGETVGIRGLDPREKFRAPSTAAQEIGWRSPSKSNPTRGLELFGVSRHGRKDKIKTLFDMVP